MVNKKCHILVVDDEQTICDLLNDGLCQCGYLCSTAFTGNEALTKLKTQNFDLLLLDIKLPDLSGIEVLREIRSSNMNILTIIITGINDVDTAVEAVKLGASDFIVKPFALDRVITCVSTALKAKQANMPFTVMDAIYHGVETRYKADYAKAATERTIRVAQQLDISEKEIDRWVTKKAILGSKLGSVIDRAIS